MKMTTTDLENLEVFNVDRDIPPFNEPHIMKMKVEKTLYSFAGVLLGYASSEAGEHRDHPSTDYAPKGVKCSACRWLEVELYRKFAGYDSDGAHVDSHGSNSNSNSNNNSGNDGPSAGRDLYVVVTRGPSIIPGERDYEKITFTESAVEVMEILTVRKTRGTQSTFLPPQHARALAQAASYDNNLKEVYFRGVA